jgi:hypothetical protein
MTMSRAVTEIDRLIEQGLSLYGEGDLDGALLLWERVLIIDPENAQANSYVDYVKINYDLLTSDGNTEHSGPFGIGDDSPEYQIEILPGEDVKPASPAPMFMDTRDEGWMIGDERGRTAGSSGPVMLELEADEPPGPIEPVNFETALTGEAISFEDATREYPGGAGRPAVALLGEGPISAEPADFVPEVTPAFGSVSDLHTPPGFGTEVTEMRRRDLGFVTPTETERRPRAPGPPELKMTLRTPGSAPTPASPPSPVSPAGIAAEPDRHRTPTGDGDRDQAASSLASLRDELAHRDQIPPSYASLELDLTPEPGAAAGRVQTAPGLGGLGGAGDAARDAEMLASLPAPRLSSAMTRPLTAKPRGSGESQPPPSEPAPDPRARPGISVGPTQELPLLLQLDPPLDPALDPALDPRLDPALGLPRAAPPEPPPLATPTRDFSDKPTHAIRGGSRADDPLISAPTVELGLRTQPRLETDEETTRELDIHRVRQARATGKAELPAMDPIDARSAEILEEVDRGAPANESREDRTRRRITALLDRASEWGRGSELERAVTAVDLALSEDPNSALSQKLIHRNRETIMNAFQAFLGDLQRTPALARPLHELGAAPISPRAAFLLSRVDGTLSLDEILDVSGMPRLEAYRYLCQLLLRGILR